jgi:predicted N-acetyltransferase YhbS
MIIRQETKKDYKLTESVIEEAFMDADYSDQVEHTLVHKLRKGKAFIPELSLVAEIDNKIVGHILFTRMSIRGSGEFESLSLAPVSVLPEFQRRGVGSKLIREGLSVAKDLGFESVIVVGHKDYYPKFGFEKASKWGITSSFEIPDEVFMATELKKESLKGKSGVIKYAEEFGFE